MRAAGSRDFLAAHDPAATRPGSTSCAPGSTPGWPGCTTRPASAAWALPRALQAVVDAEFAAAGAPDNDPSRNAIGLGMAAPTILAFGTAEQQPRWLRPLWTGEEIWCQLFSEPGAGSDLAGLATRAVSATATAGGSAGRRSGPRWRTRPGGRCWSPAPTRTCPSTPGSPTSRCDMTAPGVEVRPLRQLTGEAEFNEVFLTDVPDPRRRPDRRGR